MDIKELETLLDAKIDPLKEAIKELKEERRGQKSCSLNIEEMGAIKDIIKLKKRSVWLLMTVFSAVLLWILKDMYYWLLAHLSFSK